MMQSVGASGSCICKEREIYLYAAWHKAFCVLMIKKTEFLIFHTVDFLGI